MPEFNIWAVLVAAVAAFAVGGLWYSSLLFGKAWMAETGITEERAASANMPRTFGLAFLATLIAATVFALFLGPAPELSFAVGAGFAAGLGWVAMSFAVNDLFEQRSFKLWAINAGYHTVVFTLFGLVLGLWH